MMDDYGNHLETTQEVRAALSREQEIGRNRERIWRECAQILKAASDEYQAQSVLTSVARRGGVPSTLDEQRKLLLAKHRMLRGINELAER